MHIPGQHKCIIVWYIPLDMREIYTKDTGEIYTKVFIRIWNSIEMSLVGGRLECC